MDIPARLLRMMMMDNMDESHCVFIFIFQLRSQLGVSVVRIQTTSANSQSRYEYESRGAIWPLWLPASPRYTYILFFFRPGRAWNPESAVISVIQAADAGRTDYATHSTLAAKAN